MNLIGRPYIYKEQDCYTLVRDYYKEVLNITIPNFDYIDNWWLNGQDMYSENFEKADFIEVPFNDIKIHDGILMKFSCNVINHAAIYIGNNQILHHINNRLSMRESYNSMWQKFTCKIVRHKDLL